ncbi:MAG: hypothetical protein ABIJ00_03605 [Candidatus Eisenbacteria bacterium]
MPGGIFDLIKRGAESLVNRVISPKDIVRILGLEDILTDLLGSEPPISMSIGDAAGDDPTMDSFNPETFSPLGDMPRTEEGGFLILPGTYEFEAESYCLSAGTYSPRSGGPGYLYSNLKGSCSSVVHNALMGAFMNPQVDQDSVQMLLWAIVSGTKLEDMSPQIQEIARALLPEEDLQKLSSGLFGFISDLMLQEALDKAPESVKRIIEAVQQLRDTLAEADPSEYNMLEEIAVLRGIEPKDLLVREVPEGRWTRLPEGYFIRILPGSYRSTRIELHVPESAMIIGNPRRRSPILGLSGGGGVPGNTGSQRLGFSGRKSGDAASEHREFVNNISDGSTLLDLITLSPTLPGGIVFGWLLDWQMGIWCDIISAIDIDPPRSDFKLYSKPTPLDLSSVELEEHLSGRQVQVMKDFLRLSSELTSLLRVCRETNDRLGGALREKDMHWASEQAAVLCHFKKQAGHSILMVADKLECFIDLFQEDTREEGSISPGMLRDYKTLLSEGDYSEIAKETAAMLKLSEDEERAIRETRLKAVSEMESLTGDYSEVLQTMLGCLRELGSRWIRLPDVTPHWE